MKKKIKVENYWKNKKNELLVMQTKKSTDGLSLIQG